MGVPIAAQEASAYGVVSEGGRPIVGAPVRVDGNQTLVTDEDGGYFASLPPGPHRLTVTLHGYRPLERVVTGVRDQTAVANFPLEPVLQVAMTSFPASLARGAPGVVQLFVTSSAASIYSLETTSLRFFAGNQDRSTDFLVQPDPTSPTAVHPGETVSLLFTVIPLATARLGSVTLRASLFAFDTALGVNLIPNSSVERVNAAGNALPWFFAIDGQQLFPGASGAFDVDTAMSGRRSVAVRVPTARSGDARAYWDNAVPLRPSKQYVLSGYVKTAQLVSARGFGAAVIAPITGNLPYKEPQSPWIDGTRDWRKAMVFFTTTANGSHPIAHCRGEIQSGTGQAWFDNLALTEGPEDGSLTVSSADQSLEVTAG